MRPVTKESVLLDMQEMDSSVRNEIVSIINKEEQMYKDALEKNPNLKLEQKLDKVLSELTNMKRDVECLKLWSHSPEHHLTVSDAAENVNTLQSCDKNKNNNCLKYKCNMINKNYDDKNDKDDTNNLLEDYESCSIFSIEWMPFWIFCILILLSMSLPPIKTSTRLFL